MARSLIQKVIFGSLLILSACSSGSLMTRGEFDNIQLGTPVTEVVKEYGEPLKIRQQQDGSQLYEYVERIPIGDQTVEENKYGLVIQNGQVVSKKYNYELPPAFDEMYEEDPNIVPN